MDRTRSSRQGTPNESPTAPAAQRRLLRTSSSDPDYFSMASTALFGAPEDNNRASVITGATRQREERRSAASTRNPRNHQEVIMFGGLILTGGGSQVRLLSRLRGSAFIPVHNESMSGLVSVLSNDVSDTFFEVMGVFADGITEDYSVSETSLDDGLSIGGDEHSESSRDEFCQRELTIRIVDEARQERTRSAQEWLPAEPWTLNHHNASSMRARAMTS